MKLRSFLILLLIISSGVLVVLFKSRVEVLKVYVDEDVKGIVTDILNRSRVRFELIDSKRKGVAVFEKDRAVIPPNGEVFHFDWDERVKRKAREAFREMFGDVGGVYISASSKEITKRPIIEKAVEILTTKKGREYFENGFSILPIYFLVKNGSTYEAVFVYDPVTGVGKKLK